MSDITSQVPLPSEPARPSAGVVPELRLAPLRRLRLWPAVLIVLIHWATFIVPARLNLSGFAQYMWMLWGSLGSAAALVVWWLFFSRVSWRDRGLIALVLAGAGTAALFLCDKSLKAFWGTPLQIYAPLVITTSWVGWLVLTFFLPWPIRRLGLVVVLLLGWGLIGSVRFNGLDGGFAPDFSWRYSETADDRYRAYLDSRGKTATPVEYSPPLIQQPGDWPGFRGPDRDGRVQGVRIATDWREQPPRELWRHPVGPGWSSCAVIGDRLYTQEQRDDQEAVICLDTATGNELWTYFTPARFAEAVAGPGPRATPTFHNGNIYALGARGRLCCLDAVTGKEKWKTDIVDDKAANMPIWGFASSPLVVDDIVTVFACDAEKAEGKDSHKSVLAYKAATGKPAWEKGEGNQKSYSSLQRAKLAGVEQLLIATDEGLTAYQPTEGEVLWQYSYPLAGAVRITQPALVGDADVLVGAGFGSGTRRLHISKDGQKWKQDEVWTTRSLSPYFNDLVVYGDHMYGFDGTFFTCVSLADGGMRWRERGYGAGQVLLLADQGLLLVLTEKGEVALVRASPDGRQELARFQAIKGKTWNHPVVAHGKLFVRNGEEIACYQLAELPADKGKATP